MKIELQPAFILNTKAYLETSVLLEVFTQDFGLVAMVARGAKRGKFTKFGVLQPFMPLLISSQGKSSLHTMTGVEVAGMPRVLQGATLINGLYLNELLMRLLAAHDPHPELFAIYSDAIAALLDALDPQVILRCFEKRLLQTIGYGLPLLKDADSGAILCEDAWYTMDFNFGPKLALVTWSDAAGTVTSKTDPGLQLFKGSSLLALEREIFNNKTELQDAKRLLRQALNFRLGDHGLYSRKLLKV